jgi:maleate isomerase
MDTSPPLEQTGIGVVVPYDFALDRELWRWVPDDISLHLTRMPYAPLAATMDMAIHISDPELVANAATEVKAVSPLVTAYACTSGSFVGGLAGETALVAAMTAAGAPAAVTTAGLSSYLAEASIDVVAAAGLGLTSDIWTVPYDVTAKLVRDTDCPDAEAVFISCTNLPTYDVIAPLEAELGKPVLTANQVTMWAALTMAGRKAVGPGQQLLAR